MNAADTLALCWTNLRRRKGRTALTAAGVVVGIAALVLMISLGLGLEREVLRLFQTDDALRTLSVSRVKKDGNARTKTFNPFQLGGQIVPLTEKDLEEMRAMPGVALALPDLNMLLRVSVETDGSETSADFFPVAGVALSEEARYREILVAGRMWTPGERGCILPASLAERFGTPQGLVGRKVTFAAMVDDATAPTEERVLTITGIFDPARLGFRGRQIFLPMDRALDLRRATKGGFSFFPYKEGTYAAAEVRAADAREADKVANRLRNSGYEVIGTGDLLKQIGVIFMIFEGFLACIGAIGLLVSLFGIANTMATAVIERTREIGIMKAVGALNRDVGRVFLAEAAAIGALGGGAGLLGAFVLGKLLNAAARGVFDMPGVSLFHVPLWLAAGSVLFSMFVSVLAGYLPARRAARLDPVVALRYE